MMFDQTASEEELNAELSPPTKHFREIRDSDLSGGKNDSYESISSATEETRFDRDYRVEETIGCGSFGKVMNCLNLLDGKNYAIKEISKNHKSSKFLFYFRIIERYKGFVTNQRVSQFQRD